MCWEVLKQAFVLSHVHATSIWMTQMNQMTLACAARANLNQVVP